MMKKIIIGFASIGFDSGVFDREDTKLFDPSTNLFVNALEEFDGKKVKVTIEEVKQIE